MAKGLFEPTGPEEGRASREPLAKRLGWFVGIAVVSVCVVAAAAYVLRGLLFL